MSVLIGLFCMMLWKEILALLILFALCIADAPVLGIIVAAAVYILLYALARNFDNDEKSE